MIEDYLSAGFFTSDNLVNEKTKTYFTIYEDLTVLNVIVLSTDKKRKYIGKQ